jgi:hypothetical protein
MTVCPDCMVQQERTRRLWDETREVFLLDAVLYIIALILTWGVHIQNNNIAPATS